jgi:hypothetical protein
MDEFERQLRAALRGVSEPPPPGLMAAVRRRHARYVRRVGAGTVAAVAVVAIAVPPVTHALRAGPGASGRPGGAATAPGGGSAAPSRADRTGTVLRDCRSANGAQAGARWRAYSMRAGPVWFVYASMPGAWETSLRLPDGKLTAAGAAIAIRPGVRAVITAAPGAHGRFRFLPGFGSLDKFTLRSGRPGLTVVGCPAPSGRATAGTGGSGLTMYWVGYVTDLRGCVPLVVREQGASPPGPPVRITLPLARRSCPSR